MRCSSHGHSQCRSRHGSRSTQIEADNYLVSRLAPDTSMASMRSARLSHSNGQLATVWPSECEMANLFENLHLLLAEQQQHLDAVAEVAAALGDYWSRLGRDLHSRAHTDSGTETFE
jgi:hypothetical protein